MFSLANSITCNNSLHSQYNELLFFLPKTHRVRLLPSIMLTTWHVPLVPVLTGFHRTLNLIPYNTPFLDTVTRNSFRLIQDRTYVFEEITTKKYALTRIKSGKNFSVLLT